VAHRLPDQLNVMKGWEVLKHTAHSLGLLPNIFQLYGPFKKELKGCMFMLDDEMWDTMIEWFRQQPKEFYADCTN